MAHDLKHTPGPKQYDRYLGWSITDEPYPGARPVTGKWRAERYGVGLSAGSYEALIRMIEVKEKESRW